MTQFRLTVTGITREEYLEACRESGRQMYTLLAVCMVFPPRAGCCSMKDMVLPFFVIAAMRTWTTSCGRSITQLWGFHWIHAIVGLSRREGRLLILRCCWAAMWGMKGFLRLLPCT